MCFPFPPSLHTTSRPARPVPSRPVLAAGELDVKLSEVGVVANAVDHVVRVVGPGGEELVAYNTHIVWRGTGAILPNLGVLRGGVRGGTVR